MTRVSDASALLTTRYSLRGPTTRIDIGTLTFWKPGAKDAATAACPAKGPSGPSSLSSIRYPF
jgi:hypothetical protein